MLTRKQYELLIFIDQRLKGSGVSPSFDEMKEALDLKSKSGIHRLITGLEERGFIRRLPHRARALEVLKLPENMSPENFVAESDDVQDQGKFAPNVIRGDFKGALPGAPVANPADAHELPLWGKIAAGTPIEALRGPETVSVPASMLGRGDHYALTVEGDSMIEAGILDGDTVILKNCNTAENGDIIVALVDDNEATLKRFRRKGASIALEPANQKYETRIFGPDRVKVQGRLVGLLRNY
ncbi:MAG TPA: transcriptional repressor LexA [Candidatus Sulfotelmatobacter sp.]|jgi:repressor LexA|nr:transcriptional repressor LexA [Candidatus Sulfotelmatobacter sp.]